MKILCLLLVSFVVALAQNAAQCPPPACGENHDCTAVKEGTECANVLANSSPNPAEDFRCVCRASQQYCKCVREEGGECREWAYDCRAAPATCGDVNECPTPTTCQDVVTPNGVSARKCVCPDPRYTYNADLHKCVPTCYENSHFNADSALCVCNEGFTRDATATADTPYVYCIRNAATCDNYACETGYTCEIHENQAHCKPGVTVPKCGVDTRCPNDRYKCIDTDAGPVCKCREDFAGPNCENPKCWKQTSDTDAPNGCWWTDGHAECVTDLSGNAFCVCAAGFSGERCQNTDSTCAAASICGNTRQNVECRGGKCLCRAGFAPCRLPPTGTDVATYAYDCCPVQTHACDTIKCDGNHVCVEKEGVGACVCPYENFGGADCNKPRCDEKVDCHGNSYCVTSTRPEVPRFCTCQPGFAGDECTTPANTCTKDNCREADKRTCSNEGRCVCDAFHSGEACDVVKDQATQCKEFIMYIRVPSSGALTAEQVAVVVSALSGVDIATLKVDGPQDDEKRENVKKYIITFCSDANTDRDTAEAALADALNQGQTGGLDVTTECGPNDTRQECQSTGSDSSATTITISAFVILSVIAALLF